MPQCEHMHMDTHTHTHTRILNSDSIYQKLIAAFSLSSSDHIEASSCAQDI